MLRFLSIRRLAVIDAVEVEFDAGLNVLTGETGAGKSILVEAVGLLLGGRASADLVRTGEDAATVEAVFDSDGEEVVVRRDITAQGRSRAFVNGELVTAGALKDLSSHLVELHGQHEHQTLLDPSRHLGVLDAFGGLDVLVSATAAAFAALRRSADAVSALRRAASDRGARQELAAFQRAELERAALQPPVPGEPGEDDALAATRQVLANAERVERLCGEGYASLYESDGAVLGALAAVWRRVGELAVIDPQFQPYVDARAGIQSQLEDLAMFLRRYADRIEASPARLAAIEERLALLERIKRKYGPTLADAIARRDDLRREAREMERSDERLNELEREQAVARDEYLRVARALGSVRRGSAVEFTRQLEHLLGELAMERTRFEVRFDAERPEAAWAAQGVDRGEFFLSPNPGEDLRPLARIVSGGELSRVMLAIKTLTAQAHAAAPLTEADQRARGLIAERGDGARLPRPPGRGAPGLIFDEVDAGIGGRVADVVGRKLRTLGSTFQVLCITHLPQIAAAASTHFQIEKRVVGGRTHTSVARLDDEGRVEELTRMLGGMGVTESVRASAREMLARQRGELKPKGESERAKAKDSAATGKKV